MRDLSMRRALSWLRRWWRLSLAWDHLTRARTELRNCCPCCVCSNPRRKETP